MNLSVRIVEQHATIEHHAKQHAIATAIVYGILRFCRPVERQLPSN